MNLWGVTDIGAVRNDNQDSYRMERLDEHTALAVVCDGAWAGARAGNVASSTAVERFTQTLIEQHPQAGWLGRARCAMRWPGQRGGLLHLSGPAGMPWNGDDIGGRTGHEEDSMGGQHW